VRTFQLAVREARAFDDICVSLFGVPNSLGAVEFDAPGGGIVVASRLYSPVPTGGSVGMFIPGLPSSAAKSVSVLTDLSNGAFRTNIGVYNPNAGTVVATVRLFASSSVLLGSVSLTLAGKTGSQISNIYKTVGFDSLVTTDGYATVESDNSANPLFTYAAMADNITQDTVSITGAEDVAAPIGFNAPTPTRTSGPAVTPTPTPTPAPTSPAVIVVNLVGTRFQWSFNGGGTSFTAKVGQPYQLRISDGDPTGPAHGFGGVPSMGISSQTLSIGGPPAIVNFTPTSGQVGPNLFACNLSSCGTGHSNMVGSLQVTP
jgi:hypothetical protein